MEKSLYRKPISALLFVAGMFLFSHVPCPVHADNPNDIVVIVNKKMNIAGLSRVDVKRIFTKELTTYRGIQLKPIHAKKKTPLRDEFVSRVLGMNAAAEENYWQVMMVKKGMTPPAELSDTVRGVFSMPGAISYCYRKDFQPITNRIVLSL